MKVEVTNTNSEASEIKYPCLMKSRFSELVVLFTSATTGVCLVEGQGSQVGRYSDCFAEANLKDRWTLLPPGAEVILSND